MLPGLGPFPAASYDEPDVDSHKVSPSLFLAPNNNMLRTATQLGIFKHPGVGLSHETCDPTKELREQEPFYFRNKENP